MLSSLGLHVHKDWPHSILSTQFLYFCMTSLLPCWLIFFGKRVLLCKFLKFSCWLKTLTWKLEVSYQVDVVPEPTSILSAGTERGKLWVQVNLEPRVSWAPRSGVRRRDLVTYMQTILPNFKPWRSRYGSVNYGISNYWSTWSWSADQALQNPQVWC